MTARQASSISSFRELPQAELSGLSEQLRLERLPHENLASEARRYFCLSGEHGILGYSGLEHHGDTALLRSVVVVAAARRQGHGHELVTRTLDAARRLGVRRVFLLTTTAAQFFERMGFNRLQRDEAPSCILESEEFATQCPVSAVLMASELR
jgi:amino-acid N-acetyltransferase